MLRNAKQVLELPISPSSNQEVVGRAKELIVNPDSGKIIALALEKKGFWEKPLVLPFDKIVKIESDKISIKTKTAIVKLSDQQRALEIKKRNLKLLGNRAVTEGGDILGTIRDLEFDELSGEISRIFIDPKELKEGERASYKVPYEEVVEVTPTAVIVGGHYEKQPLSLKQELKGATLRRQAVIGKTITTKSL